MQEQDASRLRRLFKEAEEHIQSLQQYQSIHAQSQGAQAVAGAEQALQQESEAALQASADKDPPASSGKLVHELGEPARFCCQCGAEFLNMEHRFCPQCGTKRVLL